MLPPSALLFNTLPSCRTDTVTPYPVNLPIPVPGTNTQQLTLSNNLVEQFHYHPDRWLGNTFPSVPV